MTVIRTSNASRGLRTARSPRPAQNLTYKTNDPNWSTTIMSNGMQLIHEALSRARMRQPQENTSEAPRSARQISLAARQESNRWLGY